MLGIPPVAFFVSLAVVRCFFWGRATRLYMKGADFPLCPLAPSLSPSWSSPPLLPPREQAVHGADRVAVVDIDVHHGNGTQALFKADPTTFYASTHQVPALRVCASFFLEMFCCACSA